MDTLDQVYDGEWVRPIMKGWRMECCRCGLRHRFEFRVVRDGDEHIVEFRAWRCRKTKKPKK